MNYLESLKKYDSWLIHSGFKAGKYPTLNNLYYRDDSKNPDQIPGANFVIFESLDGTTTIDQLKSRSNVLFQHCVNFFKKGMGSFKLAKSFCGFFIFPLSKANPILNEYVTKTRPVSNDFSGTFFPILIDFSLNQLFFYQAITSAKNVNTNKVIDQIEFLFLPPILPPLEVTENLISIMNILRKSSKIGKESDLTQPKIIKIDEIKQIIKQLFYEGSKSSELNSVRNLIYAMYLTEFVQVIENRNDHDVIRKEGLSFLSFSSLDQLVTDMADSLGRTVVSSFQNGFSQSIRSSILKDQWAKLIKNKSITGYAFCGNCNQVVELSKVGSCPKSSFHKVETASYFEVNEHEAIQNFREKGRNEWMI